MPVLFELKVTRCEAQFSSDFQCHSATGSRFRMRNLQILPAAIVERDISTYEVITFFKKKLI